MHRGSDATTTPSHWCCLCRKNTAQNRFSELQLHTTLCGLSYTGDVRMALAEDASKARHALALVLASACVEGCVWCDTSRSQVHRIATGSAQQLRQMYRGAIARASAWRAALVRPNCGGVVVSFHLPSIVIACVTRPCVLLSPRRAQSPSTLVASDGPSFVQNNDPSARRELLAALPSGMLHRMAHVLRGKGPLAPLALSSTPSHMELPGYMGTADAPLAMRAAGAATSSSGASSSAVTGALVDVLAQAPQPQALLRRALAATVRSSSGRQALAGLLTSGLGTAARYVGRKMSKALLSRTTARGALPPLM